MTHHDVGKQNCPKCLRVITVFVTTVNKTARQLRFRPHKGFTNTTDSPWCTGKPPDQTIPER